MSWFKSSEESAQAAIVSLETTVSDAAMHSPSVSSASTLDVDRVDDGEGKETGGAQGVKQRFATLRRQPLRSRGASTWTQSLRSAVSRAESAENATPIAGADRDAASLSPRPSAAPSLRIARATIVSTDTDRLATNASEDRRAFPRAQCEGDVLVNLLDAGHRGDGAGQSLQGKLHNVSLSGVALHLEQRLEIGQRVRMRIVSDVPNRMVDTTGRLVRCEKGPHERWLIVCRLDRLLTYEQMNCVGKLLFTSTIV